MLISSKFIHLHFSLKSCKRLLWPDLQIFHITKQILLTKEFFYSYSPDQLTTRKFSVPVHWIRIPFHHIYNKIIFSMNFTLRT
jgi:hypothetical protein